MQNKPDGGGEPNPSSVTTEPEFINHRLDRLIDGARESCVDLGRAALQLEADLRQLQQDIRNGHSPVEVRTSTVPKAWRDFHSALGTVQQRVQEIRAEGYRAAVDVRGMTYSDVARLYGRSRQVVARLVEQGRTARQKHT